MNIDYCHICSAAETRVHLLDFNTHKFKYLSLILCNQGDVSSISFCMGLLRFTSEILKEFDNQNSKASFLLLMSFIKKN